MDEFLLVLALLVVGVVVGIPVLLLVALARIGALKRRVDVLEQEVLVLRADPGRQERAAVSPHAAAGTRQDPASPGPASPPPTPVASPASAPAATSIQQPPPMPVPPVAAPRAAVAPPPRQPGLVERGIATLKQWFSTGNVPVKVGMLVMLAGVAALLKYGSDQGWFHAPIELRLAGVAALAVAALVFGWRQRFQRRLFALALQGGAIGVLLLTVFAAFKLYGLLLATAAFALSVVLVAGVCVLAVAQDSRTLAVLGILAGFLAPIWLSTRSGNHVALFSYYALLNLGVFVIAWVRPWRVLNLLGFAFTFGIGTLWGVSKYLPEHYASTQPFLLLFFAFYLLIPILYARWQPARRDLVDGSLVFGTPLVAFSLQAGLLEGQRLPLALCALALAALYAGLAWALVRRPRYAALGQCHAVLAVGFATLAVPLALSARATASIFALEGAALVWLGLRQQRRLPEWAGAGLQLAAAFGFLVGMDYWDGDARALANASFMSALLLALAGLASARSWQRAGRVPAALLAYLWGLAWWLGGFVLEIQRFVAGDARADALVLLASVTAWLAAEVHRRWPSRALAMTALAGLVAVVPLALAQTAAHQQPFAGWGALGWAAVAGFGLRTLAGLRRAEDPLAVPAQLLWWLLWPIALSLAANWLATRLGLADGWALALLLLPWLVLGAVALWRWRWLALGAGDRFAAWRPGMLGLLFAVLGIGWLALLPRAGSAAPLAWIPVLNPLELVQLLVGGLAAQWLWRGPAPALLQRQRVPIIAVAGFLWLTVATLRGVHHWGGVAWDTALWRSMLAQTSLTVVWSLLGVVAWVAGSRRGQRLLWRVGAVLMAVVLAKLVLIDRQHLGNLLGIASFLAYGLLCTLVGYLAPAPPRPASAQEETA